MKKLARTSVEFVKTGIVLGVGGSLTSGNASQGISNLSSGLPVTGKIVGTSLVLKELKKIKK